MNRLLEEVRAGSGSAVLIEGPAGIGKTRMVAAARAAAERLELRVVHAAGGELERSFGFGVARQLFEPVVSHATAAERRDLFSGAAASAARIVDPLSPRDAEASSAEAEDREDAEFRLIHGLYWLCVKLAGEGPLLVAVDDAQWCDGASLRAMIYLARRLEELPVGLLLAARPSESGRDSELVGLVGGAGIEVMALAPLSQGAVAGLAQAAFEVPADPSFVAACHSATGGNPFLLQSLLAALVADGTAPACSAAEHVMGMHPAAISRAVLVRLAGLAPSARTVAEALAVLGGDAELHHLAAVAGLRRATVASAVDALESANIVEVEDRVRFVHPLVRTAVYVELPRSERDAAHRRAARALAKDGAAAQRVAAHLTVLHPTGDPWVAATLREAAHDALKQGSAESAASFLERAIAEPPPAALRAPLLRELLHARTRAGNLAQVADAADESIATLRATARELALAAPDIALALMATGRALAAVTLLEETIDALADTDTELRLRLEADLLTLAHWDSEAWPTARRCLQRLARDPPRTGTPAARLVLANLAQTLPLLGELAADESAEFAERALAAGRLIEDEGSASIQFPQAIRALIRADRLDAADAALGQALADARHKGSVLGFVTASSFRAQIALRRGALLEAEAEARGAVDAAAASGLVPAMPFAAISLAEALVERGELDEAEGVIESHGWSGTLRDCIVLTSVLFTRGSLRLAQRRFDDARDDLLECGRRHARVGIVNPDAAPWASQAALATAALGARQQAIGLARAEVASARRWGVARPLGIALRTVGLVSGDPQGMAHLEEAVQVLDGSSARLEHARAMIDLGAMMRRARRREQSREPLRRGIDLAHRCGAMELARRGRDELLATGARPRRLMLTGVDSLTASELRVARLAADGMSNAAIAQSLYVTRRTVETHLGHVYQKLDVPSRDRLAAVLRAE